MNEAKLKKYKEKKIPKVNKKKTSDLQIWQNTPINKINMEIDSVQFDENLSISSEASSAQCDLESKSSNDDEDIDFVRVLSAVGTNMNKLIAVKRKYADQQANAIVDIVTEFTNTTFKTRLICMCRAKHEYAFES